MTNNPTISQALQRAFFEAHGAGDERTVWSLTRGARPRLVGTRYPLPFSGGETVVIESTITVWPLGDVAGVDVAGDCPQDHWAVPKWGTREEARKAAMQRIVRAESLLAEMGEAGDDGWPLS